MERVSNFEPIFPPEFAHFEQPLRDTQAEVQKIEDEINRLPRDKGLRFELKSPGAVRVPNNFYTERMAELKLRKTYIKDMFTYKVDEALKGSDPIKAEKIRDTVSIHIGDNKARFLNRDELAKATSIHKEPDLASDFMDKILSNARADAEYRKMGIQIKSNSKSNNIEPDKD